MRKLILALVITIMAATLAAADTITLHDGRTVRGQVLGFVNGRFAVRLTANLDPPTTMQTESQSNRTGFTGSGEVGDVLFIHPRSIQRIDIDGRSLADARYVMRNVRVVLGPNWVDTGLDLQRGETVRIRANGAIVVGDRRIPPAGTGSTDPYAPLPRASEGTLIGVIGEDLNSPIIEIGADREFTTDREGRLYLTANRNSFSDARGAFNARVFRDIRIVQQAAGNRDDYDDVFEMPTQGQPGRVRRRDRPGGGGGGQPQPPLPSGPQEWTVSVPGNSRGVDTSVDVRTGDILNITATGNIVAGRRVGEVSPDGQRTGFGALLGTRPVPSAGVGALIGYIRLTNGQITQPFIVGSQQSITAPADGRLFLLVNDDDYSDNSGSFTVRIARTGSQGGGGGGFPSQGGGDRAVTVYANSRDTDTGIELRSGQRVSFSATGAIYSRNATTSAISPEGYRRTQAGSYPMRDATFGSLIGYIRLADGRASQPFYIGTQRTIDAPQSGRLYLLVNDDDYRDNSGSFQVRVSY